MCLLAAVSTGWRLPGLQRRASSRSRPESDTNRGAPHTARHKTPAANLRQASNPFVVRFYYSFSSPEKLFLVMEVRRPLA